jgi:hypothetical protein
MNHKVFWMIIPVLALVSIACRFTINMPFTEIKTGPVQTDIVQIEVPAGGENVSNVSLLLGAGELFIRPGTDRYLVDGVISYNVHDFQPRVGINHNNVSIEQGQLDVSRISILSSRILNTWDLNLGHVPMQLIIQAGGYKGELELGGLEIQRLEISDGASDVQLSFSEPNPGEMDIFRYTTGASNIKLSGLLNANFREMHFRSGAGNYLLDFSGDLLEDAVVQIETGFSNIKLVVPEGVNAEVSVEGALTNMDARGDWVRSGNAYVTRGSGALLQIQIKMGAGNIELSTR